MELKSDFKRLNMQVKGIKTSSKKVVVKIFYHLYLQDLKILVHSEILD